MKAELRYRSEAHSKFAEEVSWLFTALKVFNCHLSLSNSQNISHLVPVHISYKENWRRKCLSTRRVRRKEEKKYDILDIRIIIVPCPGYHCCVSNPAPAHHGEVKKTSPSLGC